MVAGLDRVALVDEVAGVQRERLAVADRARRSRTISTRPIALGAPASAESSAWSSPGSCVVIAATTAPLSDARPG